MKDIITAEDIQYLKDSCIYIEKACMCNRGPGFDDGERHKRLGMVPDGGRWLTPAERVFFMRKIIDKLEVPNE
jgi:hypothetical protein